MIVVKVIVVVMFVVKVIVVMMIVVKMVLVKMIVVKVIVVVMLVVMMIVVKMVVVKMIVVMFVMVISLKPRTIRCSFGLVLPGGAVVAAAGLCGHRPPQLVDPKPRLLLGGVDRRREAPHVLLARGPLDLPAGPGR